MTRIAFFPQINKQSSSHPTTLHPQLPTYFSTFSTQTITSTINTINMSDNNSSTLGSYVNQATGMAQRAFGAVTGDSSTEVCSTPSPSQPLPNHQHKN